MDIQWYPGHMAKTKKILLESLKTVDIIIEMLDARIPFSSKNPVLDKISGNKPRITVINKYDLADMKVCKIWSEWFGKHNMEYLFINSQSGKGLDSLIKRINSVMSGKIKKSRQKGLRNYRVKTMVAGIPNVGKSSLINRLAGRKSARTGDKPGITKGKQWIRIGANIDLLDTPGILWPKFQDRKVGMNLAFTGAIRDEVLDIEETAVCLLDYLSKNYPEAATKRYGLEKCATDAFVLFEDIGKRRGFLMSGGEVDTVRTASMILDEYRNGKLGGISLERPDDPHVGNPSTTFFK